MLYTKLLVLKSLKFSDKSKPTLLSATVDFIVSLAEIKENEKQPTSGFYVDYLIPDCKIELNLQSLNTDKDQLDF